MNNTKYTIAKTFEWSRYRFRLWKNIQDIPRDFNDWRKICFKHMVEHSLCHCNEEHYHFMITPKIAIPNKGNKKKWKNLEKYLKQNGDNPEVNISYKLIPITLLSKNERLILNVTGKAPNRIFHNH